jgi:hypothetical protein
MNRTRKTDRQSNGSGSAAPKPDGRSRRRRHSHDRVDQLIVELWLDAQVAGLPARSSAGT